MKHIRHSQHDDKLFSLAKLTTILGSPFWPHLSIFLDHELRLSPSTATE